MDCFQMAMAILDDRPKITPDMTLEEKIKNTKLYFEANAAANRLMGELTPRWVFFSPEQAEQAFFEQRAREAGMPSTPMPAPMAYPSTVTDPQPAAPAKGMTIQEMTDAFIGRKQVGDDEKKRNRSLIRRYGIEVLGVSPDDDFGVMTSREAVTKISDAIMNTANCPDWKKDAIGLFRNLLSYAGEYSVVTYDTRSKSCLAEVRTKGILTEASEGVLPLDTSDLHKIFSTDCDLFDKLPDYFWVFLIALCIGSRRNAAITPQYKDIVEKDGIPCIRFTNDDPRKKLKTTATLRTVPIHPLLITLGFLDMIAERKKRLNAADTDFIFQGCMNANGNVDTHFSEKIKKFFIRVGIKNDGKDENGRPLRDGKSFHSLRDTASKRMQLSGVKKPLINAIIGWAGEGMMEQKYSKYTVAEQLDAMNLYNYDEIMPELLYWADRLHGK